MPETNCIFFAFFFACIWFLYSFGEIHFHAFISLNIAIGPN